jgi:alpha-D-xyloside xylohydrolase
VYLPQGTKWIDFWSGATHEGGTTVSAAAPLEQIPLFLRAGAIVPFGPDVQYAMEKPADPIELRIYPGADGDFTLYEDQGDSYNYENGVYSTISFHWSNSTHTLSIGKRTGDFPGMLKTRTFQVTLVEPNRGTGSTLNISPGKVVHYDGTAQSVLLK